MSAIINAYGISYELPNGRELFAHLTFSLDDRLTGLVGPNGIGKTLLARVLAGELLPSAGAVRGTVRLFRQRELPAPISVAEYLSADYEWSLIGERLLHGIRRELLCTQLSGGQWMRVRLARAVAAEYLILDEPTNDLDREGRDALLQFLRERNGGAMLISHDRECLELCAQIFELSNRGLAVFGGGWSAYEASKALERERQVAALDAAKRERDAAYESRHEQRERQGKRNRRGAERAARGGAAKIWLGARKRQAEASTGKLDAATLQKSEAAVREAHEALAEMKIDPVMYADLIGCALPAQKLIAEASGFNLRFDEWVYAQDLNFCWRGNVRVALQGSNGSGKSTLLRVLQGASYECRGELRRGDVRTLYLDQQCSVLDDALSVLENVRAVTRATETELRTGLARFLFAGDAVFQQVADLSGGERLRAALARGFLSTQAPELLLLDEPTNNLDVTNVEFLEALVREFPAALIVVSHDARFLHNCGITEELELPTMNR